jgi:hypothetical protein
MGSGPAFSRPPRSSLLGKRTVTKHTKLDEETADGLRALAAAAGMSESEFIADVLTFRVHGEDMLRSVMEQRIAVVSGKGLEKR